MRRFKTAFLLGAGLGTRLKPLTDKCPKPLLPVDGRPIITYGMDHLLTVGVERFIVNTHHHPDAYRVVFPDGRWRGREIIFVYEPQLLDTGGGLKNIEHLLSEDGAIICYNGDIITDLPLKRLFDGHNEKKGEVTLVLRSNGSPQNVSLDEEGYVCDLRHTLGVRGTGDYLFTGIYAVERSFLGHIPRGQKESIIVSFLRRMAEVPRVIAGVVIDGGQWFDLGSPEEYERAELLVKTLCLTKFD
ncbi:MAG: nucleotidyltransferase family protein [Syntrophorhabdaceae bacterium]|nr:nucleotidyltransferase family protein [Syntrophorhabdaceae bacterium]